MRLHMAAACSPCTWVMLLNSTRVDKALVQVCSKAREFWHSTVYSVRPNMRAACSPRARPPKRPPLELMQTKTPTSAAF